MVKSSPCYVVNSRQWSNGGFILLLSGPVLTGKSHQNIRSTPSSDKYPPFSNMNRNSGRIPRKLVVAKRRPFCAGFRGSWSETEETENPREAESYRFKIKETRRSKEYLNGFRKTGRSLYPV
ncbi:MAG: hypothetical protein C4576_34635 [Desulfobacteraceae bacterium]|nr:MAG: hypothetical protein C4576_34635 [Desulfobacteraceae bacterium]